MRGNLFRAEPDNAQGVYFTETIAGSAFLLIPRTPQPS